MSNHHDSGVDADAVTAIEFEERKKALGRELQAAVDMAHMWNGQSTRYRRR
jgi:muconolactone delta-isomerase